MKDEMIELQKEVAVGVNNKECKECPFFSLKNDKLICNFDPYQVGARCIRLEKLLDLIP